MTPSASILSEALGFGVLTSAVIGLGAVGFTLQFGISNILNLAYASVMALGMFSAYWLHHAGVGIWAVLPLAGLIGAAVSYAINLVIYRPFQRKTANLFTVILATVAVGLIITNALEGIVGETFFSYGLPPSAEHVVASFHFSTDQLVVFLIALGAMAVVQALLQATGLGRAMRATAADRALAANCGIPTDRVTDVAWLVSGFLCGLAGVTLAMQLGSFTPTTAGDSLVIVIAAAVLGGIGRPAGAILGALVVSIAGELVSAEVDPVYKPVVGLAILILVLLLRPQGILSLGRVRAG